MKALKKIFDFYIFSNIHVGIATACLVLVSTNNIATASISYSSYFVFFSTVLAYHFIRIFENCECTLKAVYTYLKQQPKEILIVTFFALFGTLFFGFLIGFSKFWIILPVIFITFWYAVPLFNYKGKRISLRNYPTVKMLSIAFVWAVITVLFPLQESISNSQVWLEFVQRFFLVMALVIPFDIRDLQTDDTHIQTLPQKIGVAKAKLVAAIYIILFFALSIVKAYFDKSILIPELLVFIISLFFIAKSTEEKSRYFTAFWLESIPILWFGLLLAIKAVT